MEEDCGVCGTTVPFSVTTHVMLNPAGEDGVHDYYVCGDCYEAHLAGLFESAEATETDDPDEAAAPTDSEE